MTTAGTALAVALVPLVVGVLVAKGIAADPMTPVNALITGGGQRAGLPRAEWRRRGHATMCRLRTVRRAAAPRRRKRAAPPPGDPLLRALPVLRSAPELP